MQIPRELLALGLVIAIVIAANRAGKRCHAAVLGDPQIPIKGVPRQPYTCPPYAGIRCDKTALPEQAEAGPNMATAVIPRNELEERRSKDMAVANGMKQMRNGENPWKLSPSAPIRMGDYFIAPVTEMMRRDNPAPATGLQGKWGHAQPIAPTTKVSGCGGCALNASRSSGTLPANPAGTQGAPYRAGVFDAFQAANERLQPPANACFFATQNTSTRVPVGEVRAAADARHIRGSSHVSVEGMQLGSRSMAHKMTSEATWAMPTRINAPMEKGVSRQTLGTDSMRQVVDAGVLVSAPDRVVGAPPLGGVYPIKPHAAQTSRVGSVQTGPSLMAGSHGSVIETRAVFDPVARAPAPQGPAYPPLHIGQVTASTRLAGGSIMGGADATLCVKGAGTVGGDWTMRDRLATAPRHAYATADTASARPPVKPCASCR